MLKKKKKEREKRFMDGETKVLFFQEEMFSRNHRITEVGRDTLKFL